MNSGKIVYLSLFLSTALLVCSEKEPEEGLHPSNLSLKKHSKKFRREIVKVTEGVYVAIGYGLANSVLLAGTEGRVIVDVMESVEAAIPVKKAFDKISRLPLKAIIYTHFHTDHIFGAGAFAEKKKIDVYSHETTQKNIDRVTSITREITYKRAMRMFGTYLPEKSHVNCGIGPFLKVRHDARLHVIRPNKTFANKLDLNIAGIKMKLIHAPGETDDQIVVWLPEKKVLLAADNYYKSFPNLYTIRGTKYRDVLKWAESLDMMRSLKAEYLVPGHSRPVTGASEIDAILRDYSHAIRYVHDQTIRGINRGLFPDELVQAVKLPKHLAEKPYLKEYYGRVSWSVRSIFNGYLGWFSGNETELNPLPPGERAKKIAELAGGEKALLEKAEDAFNRKSYQWVLELTDYLLLMEPGLKGARELKSASLYAMGKMSENANERNYYLSRAMEIEEKIQIKDLVIRKRVAHNVPLDAIFRGMTVRLDPEKSINTNKRVRFHFVDLNKNYTVHVNRGVAIVEVDSREKADLSVELKSNIWKEIVAKLRSPVIALAKGDIRIEGSIIELVRFLKLFQQ
jgi:alkyl sulfatase BDS1-like metallo-beta-lactamase superfamily hydrolase